MEVSLESKKTFSPPATTFECRRARRPRGSVEEQRTKRPCIWSAPRTRPHVVSGWSDEEVARRWLRLCPGRRDQIGASVEADRVAMLAETPEASEYCGAGDRLRARRGRAELAAWRASGGDESSAADVPAFALRATARQAEEIERARGDVERARWLAPVEAGEGGVLGMSEEQWLYLPEAGAKSASATMPRFFWF